MRERITRSLIFSPPQGGARGGLSNLTLTSLQTNADGVEFKADFVEFKADGARALFDFITTKAATP